MSMGNITANDFFRTKMFAATWTTEQMNEARVTGANCIQLMNNFSEIQTKNFELWRIKEGWRLIVTNAEDIDSGLAYQNNRTIECASFDELYQRFKDENNKESAS